MFNILVIEDSTIQRKALIHILLQTGLDLKIYEATNEKDSLEIADNVDIDLFFVDIDLNESSGLDFALKIREIDKYKLSWIIFATIHMNYMIGAFKNVHCYDYILKPYDPEKIVQLTKTIVEGTKNKDSNHNTKKNVVFNNKGVNLKISTDDIIFLEVNIKKCIIYTKFGKFEISRLTLKEALQIIDEPFIIRSHKSFAINTNYIIKIEKYSVTSWNVYFKDYEFSALISLRYKRIINNVLLKL